MRGFLLAVVACALAACGCGGSQVDTGMCKAPVSGGSAAEREVVTRVMCGMSTNVIEHVTIRRAPRGEPAGGTALVIVARVPRPPASARSPRVAVSDFADETASWDAEMIAGAVRDRSRRAHLPHVVAYDLRFREPGGKSQLQSQGRIALPGWGDPEGQGSLPPSTLGHGVPSGDALQRHLTTIAAQTHTTVSVGFGTPLGLAPSVVITAPDPREFLAGPIRRYLAAVEFTQARYDGVLIAVVDTKGRPVWAATTAVRVGDSGCSVLSTEAGRSHGSFRSFNSAGDRACAAAGVEFS